MESCVAQYPIKLAHETHNNPVSWKISSCDSKIAETPNPPIWLIQGITDWVYENMDGGITMRNSSKWIIE